MRPQLTEPALGTYNGIFQYPLPRNLRWDDVHALLDVLTTVIKGQDGSLRLARNGQKLFLHRPQRSVVTAQEVMNIRRFLENSEPPAAPPATVESPPT
jgi:hypothetical protein